MISTETNFSPVSHLPAQTTPNKKLLRNWRVKFLTSRLNAFPQMKQKSTVNFQLLLRLSRNKTRTWNKLLTKSWWKKISLLVTTNNSKNKSTNYKPNSTKSASVKVNSKSPSNNLLKNTKTNKKNSEKKKNKNFYHSKTIGPTGSTINKEKSKNSKKTLKKSPSKNTTSKKKINSSPEWSPGHKTDPLKTLKGWYKKSQKKWISTET